MNTDTVSQLTKLLAAHGVYALTILFIFYQQRSTYADFLKASTENRLFLQRVYKSAVIATYVLAALSTCTWAYATFRTQPYAWVGGAIDDVRNEIGPPADPRDPPSIVESIEPQGGGLQQFLSKTENCDPKTRLCQLRWVLRTRSDVPSVLFKFRHSYVIAKPKPSAADPIESPVRGLIYDSATIDARFTLDAAAMDLLAGHELSLTYERHEDAKRIGRLFLRRANQQPVQVPWETLPRDATSTPSDPVAPITWFPSPSRLWTVWAAERSPAPKPAFGPQGEYEEAYGQGLRSWLGGPNVDNQLMAVRILVEARSRAFRFMGDALKATTPTGVNASVLIGNVVRAAEQIEALGTRLPAGLVVSLAVASSKSGSYAASAQLFDKAGAAPLTELETYFYRGLAYRESKRYDDAITDLERYARDVSAPYSKAVALTSIGMSYRRSGHPDKAVAAYERAIKAYPDYAGSYNALAYLYALDQKRTDFSMALSLVDHALKLRPNDPNYLDTKGWVLFRAGKYDEALNLLQTASAAQPENTEIREHLDQARKASIRAVQFGKT